MASFTTLEQALSNPEFCEALDHNDIDKCLAMLGYQTEACIKFHDLVEEEASIDIWQLCTHLYRFMVSDNVSVYNIPASIKYVQSRAFENKVIDKVVAPEGLSAMAVNSFYNSKIKTIQLPSTLTDVGPMSFASSDIQAIDVSMVKELGGSVFVGCIHLTEVKLPSDLLCIPYNSFKHCAALKHVDIPARVKKIGWDAFCETGLQSIELPEGLEYIEEKAFYNCRNLKEVYIPKSVKYVHDQAFQIHPEGKIYLHSDTDTSRWSRVWTTNPDQVIVTRGD